jgi:type IV secretory pathway TrbD component
MAFPRGSQGPIYIVGYQMEIRKGLWERIKTLGVPRILGALWLALCGSAAFACAMLVSLKAGGVPMGLWLVGHATMVVLTQMDPHWDDVALAQLMRRYKTYYEAG